MNICYKDLYLIFLTIIVIYLFFKDISKTERFTDIAVDDAIRSVVNELYNEDILAIRRLSNYATQITNGPLSIDNNVKITQDLSCKNINSSGNVDISGNIIIRGDITTDNTIKCTKLNIQTSNFRYIPWRSCGFAFNSSSVNSATFDGAITCNFINSPYISPKPALNSTCTYIYSVIGNTMYLQFTYNARDENRGIAGSGIYLYNLPNGYEIDTSVIAIQSPLPISRIDTSIYATAIGRGDIFIFNSNSNSNSKSNYTTCMTLYATSSKQICTYIPRDVAGEAKYWNNNENLNYNYNHFHQTINCSFPIK